MNEIRKIEIIKKILPDQQICQDLMDLAVKCANVPPENDGWRRKQNNHLDNLCKGIIYDFPTIAELQKFFEENGITDEKAKNYTERRLLNTIPSITVEKALCEAGAIKNENVYDKDCDVYFGDLPVDVKISVLSKKWDYLDFDDPLELENYAWWNYENQSKGQRKNYQNRLIFVCCGESLEERLVAKANLTELISAGVDYMENGPKMTKLLVRDEKGFGHTVYYDLVPVNWKKQLS